MAGIEESDINPRILELNKQLEGEIASWQLLGVMPENVIQFNPVKNDIWLQCITKFLAEKGIIDEDEFVIFFKECMLSTLSQIRKQIIEPQAARAQIHLPGSHFN